MKIFKWILLTVLFLYFAAGLFLYIKQRSFIYFPTPVIHHNYEQLTFYNVSNINGASDNKRFPIKTTLLNKGRQNAIIYLGGNGEAVDLNAKAFSQTFPNESIYLLKYRGYSGSPGSPSEAALYSDALALYDSIKDKYSNISVIGRSLGSGIASYLASKRPITKLTLITPFDSIQSIAQDAYPIFPMRLLLKDKYDSLSRVNAIKAKTLFLIAENDQFVSRKHSSHLINAFPASQIHVEIIRNSGHNTLSNQPIYYNLLNKFIEHTAE